MMSDSHNLMREYSISYCFICHFLVGLTSIFIAYLMAKGMAVKDPQSSLVNYLKKTYCRTFGSCNWKSRTFMSLCLGIKGRGLLLYKRTMFLDFIQVHTTSPASNQKKKKDQNSEVHYSHPWPGYKDSEEWDRGIGALGSLKFDTHYCNSLHHERKPFQRSSINSF